MGERNVLGEDLEPCGTDPVTGFYRDGCCSTGPEDLGSHTICAVLTAEFLEHQRGIGNDLSTPRARRHTPFTASGAVIPARCRKPAAAILQGCPNSTCSAGPSSPAGPSR